MRFRRCMVRQRLHTVEDRDGLRVPVLSPTTRYAWIPIERATLGACVDVQYPGEDKIEVDIMALDTLVVAGRYLAHLEDVPT